MNDVVCDSKKCGKPYESDLVKYLCNPAMYERMVNKSFENMQFGGLFKCRKCGTPYYMSKETKKRAVFCSKCNITVCRLCREPMHDGPCECRKETLTLMSADTMYMPCPNCLSIAGKNDHCDHVNCGTCKVEWCFVCSALREPTRAHNANCLHRKHCTHYTFMEDHMFKMEKDCPECQRLKRRCNRPKDLVNHDIPVCEFAEDMK